MLFRSLRSTNSSNLQFFLKQNFSSESSKKPKNMADLMKKATLVSMNGTKVNGQDHLKDKVVALYFSASWCPPCRIFTPKLKKFYDDLQTANKNFEIVFVSRDRNAENLYDYFLNHHGAWTYLEYDDPLIPQFLKKYEIATIPSLKVIKPDGTVVVSDARREVEEKGADAVALFEEWLSFYIV